MLKTVTVECNQILEIKTDKTTIALPFGWLRDYCQCNKCVHTETKQRLFNTFSLPKTLTIKQASIIDNELVIQWGYEEHTSVYTAAFIEGLRPDPENLDINRNLWTAYTFNNTFPGVTYDKVIADDTAVRKLLELTEAYGFCFVEGTPPTPEGTQAVADRVAYTRQTIFGGYYEMVANLEHKDTAYTPLAIEPHTDGTYSNDAPSYQVLHCLEEDCIGGENVLVDGFQIAGVMYENHLDDYQTLSEVYVPGQYIDIARNIHLISRRPVFRHDDTGNLVQVSYNNHDRAPFITDPDQIKKFYKALNTFAELYSRPEFHYRRKLLPGSCLFFDNWRILHARDAYSGYRKLAGVYFNKEDVESRLRMLRSKHR